MELWKESVGGQLGAAVDMLEYAIAACPDALWSDRERRPEFWYVAYHTLFLLDLYLSDSVDGFAPPAPFTLTELDDAEVMPERPYTKAELLAYVEHGRAKLHATLAGLTEEQARRRCQFDWLDLTFAELLVYNLRHVQHHAGQLNLILRQETGAAPGWVRRSRE